MTLGFGQTRARQGRLHAGKMLRGLRVTILSPAVISRGRRNHVLIKPMSFSSFHGNAEVVRRMRAALERERFPHGVIITGPTGAGKYTLALMMAQAMNCLTLP